MPQQFSNNARASLLVAVSAIDTTLLVTTLLADSFPTANTGTSAVGPSTNWFKATLEDSAGNVEIVYVRTRVSGSNALSNVQRGQEGTTARSFGVGSVVSLRLTAQDHATVRDVAQTALETAEAAVPSADLALPGAAEVIGRVGSGPSDPTDNVQRKLREWVSLADSGAYGDGRDDRAAILLALAKNKPILWEGLIGNNFAIASPIAHTPTDDVIWYGRGASITYTGSHVQTAIQLSDATGVQFQINDLTIDGGKLTNKPLEVLNNTSMSTPSEFVANNLKVKRAKRSNAFLGGDGVYIRGAFSKVELNGGLVSDCELPAGQGTPGSAGIAGVNVDFYGATSYVREVVVNGLKVEKIYSSDLTYNDDQDGIIYFVPTVSGAKVPSKFVCYGGSEFVNCYGRSIKTQCQSTSVTDSVFSRSEGLSRGFGNGEIDAQTGSLFTERNTYRYTGGNQPGFCVNSSANLGKPGLTTRDEEVFLDSATTLTTFAQAFAVGAGLFARHNVTDNKIYGKVQQFFSYLCDSNKNYADVSRNYVQEIVNGVTSEKALIYVRAFGSTSPFFANITATGNVYDNTHLPALVRDGISGASMSSALSQWGNFGFLTNDVAVNPAVSGLKTNSFAQVDKIGAANGVSYGRVMDITLPASGALEIDVGNLQGAALLVQMGYDNQSCCLISTTPSANTKVVGGTNWVVGNTTDPGSGVFRMWSSGTRKVSLRSTDGARSGVLWVLSPGT